MNAITTPEVTALTVIERAAIALESDTCAKQLAELAAQSKSIVTVTNKAGRDECHQAAMTAKDARLSVEKAAKAAREDATAFSKAVIAEEKRLVAIIEPEESRLLKIRDEWDFARAAERAAAEQVGRERVAAIRKRIDAIRDAPLNVLGQSSGKIAAEISKLEDVGISDMFAEFSAEAAQVRGSTIGKLQAMLAATQAAEAEAIRVAQHLAAERAAREEAERQASEARRIAAEEEAKARAEAEAQKAAERAAFKAEQDKLAAERAEFARQQAEAKRQADEARAKAEAEQAAIRAEEERKHAAQQAEIARQQAVIDAAERAQREAAEKAEADRQRRAELAALTPPDADAIIAFVADHWARGDYDTAQRWLIEMDFSS